MSAIGIMSNGSAMAYTVNTETTGSGWTAYQDNNGTMRYGEGPVTLPAADSYSFWACAGDGDPAFDGDITRVDVLASALTALDVSALLQLAGLVVNGNPLLGDNLNITGLTGLTVVGVADCGLSAARLDRILQQLWGSGAAPGEANFTDNLEPLGAVGWWARSRLQARGWAVTVSGSAPALPAIGGLVNVGGAVTAQSTSGWTAFRDPAGVFRYADADPVVLPLADSCTFWACTADGDPTPAGAITELSVSGTNLTRLDVTDLTGLTILRCSDNALTALDVTGLSQLHTLLAYNNALDSAAVDAVLVQLVAAGSRPGGEVSLHLQTPPAIPGPAGAAAIVLLALDGFTVNVDTEPPSAGDAFYNNAAGDDDVANAANWWADEAGTVPLGVAPDFTTGTIQFVGPVALVGSIAVNGATVYTRDAYLAANATLVVQSGQLHAANLQLTGNGSVLTVNGGTVVDVSAAQLTGTGSGIVVQTSDNVPDLSGAQLTGDTTSITVHWGALFAPSLALNGTGAYVNYDGGGAADLSALTASGADASVLLYSGQVDLSTASLDGTDLQVCNTDCTVDASQATLLNCALDLVGTVSLAHATCTGGTIAVQDGRVDASHLARGGTAITLHDGVLLTGNADPITVNGGLLVALGFVPAYDTSAGQVLHVPPVAQVQEGYTYGLDNTLTGTLVGGGVDYPALVAAVQEALTNQGYTTDRANRLDHFDVPVSTRLGPDDTVILDPLTGWGEDPLPVLEPMDTAAAAIAVQTATTLLPQLLQSPGGGGLVPVTTGPDGGIQLTETQLTLLQTTAAALGPVDGVPMTKLMRLLLSFMYNKNTIKDFTDGTRQVTFFARDGRTVLAQVRYRITDGKRTASTIP